MWRWKRPVGVFLIAFRMGPFVLFLVLGIIALLVDPVMGVLILVFALPPFFIIWRLTRWRRHRLPDEGGSDLVVRVSVAVAVVAVVGVALVVLAVFAPR